MLGTPHYTVNRASTKEKVKSSEWGKFGIVDLGEVYLCLFTILSSLLIRFHLQNFKFVSGGVE